jgi:gas vesicle protein
MSERDEFVPFLAGFIVGGLFASAIALLFAPQSGEDTRALIKDKSIELRDKAQLSAEEAIARAESAVDAFRGKLKRADEASMMPNGSGLVEETT